MTEVTDRDQAVFALLRDSGPLTTREVAQGVTGTPYAGHVDTELRRLHREGRVDRTPPHSFSRILWWVREQS